jgi:hypothetical protein
MFTPDPGSLILILPIPDPEFRIQKQKMRSEKKFVPRMMELFTQKFVTKLSKIWAWDPGSGKKNFADPGSGSRGQKGSGSATL